MGKLTICLAVFLGVVTVVQANIIFGGGSRPPSQPPKPTAPHLSLGDSCTIPGGGNGLCIRVQDCPSLMKQLNSGNVSALRKLVCGKWRSQTLLCCPNEVTTPPATVDPPAGTDADTCGITTLYEPPRVVGGQPVEVVGTFPWMTALRYSSGKLFQCGAAVIARRWLLTASHCVNIPGGPVAVRIGDLDIYSPKEDDTTNPPQDIEVEHLIRHPQYRRTFRGLQNDVALIRLKSDIKYSNTVRPICLPTQKADVPPSGATVVAGWGLTENDDANGSNVMQYAELNITNINTCQQNYLRSRGNRVYLDQHLCASGNITARGGLLSGCQPGDDSILCQGGVDACKGDSGGPLMSYERLPSQALRLTAVGVSSFGQGCGDPLYPGVYARVDSYVDWLHETMAEYDAGR